MRIVVVILIAGMCGSLFADTIPGGDVSGTWYAANSPYYINGYITIPENDTLIIEPGVTVNFLVENSTFIANGFLKAEGTATDSIQFFNNDSTPGVFWWGIQLNDTAMGYTYQLSYCTFGRMIEGITHHPDAGNVTISNCRFYSCGYGISWETSQEAGLQVTDCVFQSWWFSAIRTTSGGGLFEVNGCLFDTNFGWDYNEPTIWAIGRTGSLNIANCVFRNNWITADGGAAINCTSCDSVYIEECVFAGNINHCSTFLEGGGAIFLSSTDASISRCLFYDNDVPDGPLGDAIMIRRPGSWTIDHCTFWGFVPGGNNVNIYVEGDYDTLSSLTVSNSIFTYAYFNLEIVNPLAISVEHSAFFGNFRDIDIDVRPPGFGVFDTVNYNGDSCDCYYNIFMNPLFADTSNRDFHLTAGSPCIDAGDPAYAYDPDGTITDMGCYWFDQGTGVAESPVVKRAVKRDFPFATVFSGPLVLPRGKTCRIFDITGRQIKHLNPAPGIYFLEIDDKIVQKIIKVQ